MIGRREPILPDGFVHHRIRKSKSYYMCNNGRLIQHVNTDYLRVGRRIVCKYFTYNGESYVIRMVDGIVINITQPLIPHDTSSFISLGDMLLIDPNVSNVIYPYIVYVDDNVITVNINYSDIILGIVSSSTADIVGHMIGVERGMVDPKVDVVIYYNQ